MKFYKSILTLASIVLLNIQCSNKNVTSDDCYKGKIRDLAYTDSFSSQMHFQDLYENAEMKYTFRGKTKADFDKWQLEFRGKLKEKLGYTKIEEQLSEFKLRAQKVDSEDIGFAIRERWIIWTEPTVPLPFVLLLPKEIDGKRPLMITPHGHGKNTESYAGIYHSEQEKIDGEIGERNVAIQAVKEGFIAIAPTARGFGQTRTPEDKEKDATSSCRILFMHDLLVGRTPIGDRVWDISKLIDWAIETLPIDQSKIVVSGNSGGGTATLFAGACDTRISISIPSSYFCTFTGSIGSIHHCDCNYVPGILDYGEMADIAGLTAPRLFCALNGKEDKIFPINEVQKAFSELKKIYTVAGVPDNCELYIGDKGHRYYKEGAWKFIHKHISNKQVPMFKIGKDG